MAKEIKNTLSQGGGVKRSKLAYVLAIFCMLIISCLTFYGAYSFFTARATQSSTLQFGVLSISAKKNGTIVSNTAVLTNNTPYVPGQAISVKDITIENTGAIDCYALMNFSITITPNQQISPSASVLSYSTWYNLNSDLVHTYDIECNKTTATELDSGDSVLLDFDYYLSAEDIDNDYLQASMSVSLAVYAIQKNLPSLASYTGSEKANKIARKIVESAPSVATPQYQTLTINLGDSLDKRVLVAGSTIQNAMHSVGLDTDYSTITFYTNQSRTLPVDVYSCFWSDTTIYSGTAQTTNLTHTVSAGQTAITSGSSATGAVIIPSAIYDDTSGDYVNVTSISAEAFKGNDDITSVYIPSTVTSIGNYAFSDCDSLTYVNIPNSVTSIGSYAFSDSKLAEIDFEDEQVLASLSNYVFKSTKIQEITIPASVTSIGSLSFGYCNQLTEVNFEENSNLTTIGYGAFINCNQLISIKIPEGVVSIGEEAFDMCYALTTIYLPSTLTSIGKAAFKRTNLNNFIIAEGNTEFYMDENCLMHNSTKTLVRAKKSSTSAYIPAYTLIIGAGAYSSITSAVGTLTIPEGVQRIEANAFGSIRCRGELIFPKSLTYIGGQAFEDTYFTSVYIQSNIEFGTWYSWILPRADVTAIRIGEDVTRIDSHISSNINNSAPITFDDTTYKWSAGGTVVSIADASANVTMFKTTYAGKTWTKTDTLDS